MLENWDKFISENRDMIDEFLGPNQDKYIEISLKGLLIKKIGKEKAFEYFEFWEEKDFSARQKCKQIREILKFWGN